MSTQVKRRGRLKTVILVLIGAPLGVALIAAIINPHAAQSGGSAAPDDAVAQMQARKQADDALLDKAQAIIQQGLKDPSSAEFSDGYHRQCERA